MKGKARQHKEDALHAENNRNVVLLCLSMTLPRDELGRGSRGKGTDRLV